MKNIGLIITRILVGGLFIFSGLVKLNDPAGTAIKLAEYFQVFSEDISEIFMILVPASMFLSVFLSGLEVVLGFAVLINYRMKITSWILLLLIVFFTFLTFYSAYFNKVQDCGCFGDAIPLTPWQSFSKDIILTILILILFVFKNDLKPLFDGMKEKTIMLGSVFISLMIALVAIKHLPFIDFRPYAVGESIPTNMVLPEGAKPTIMQIDYTLENKNSGEVKVMTDKEYMDTQIWKDTNWVYVSASEPVLIQEGDKPKIASFMFNTEEGDKTESLFVGEVLLITSALLEKSNMESFKEIGDLTKELQGVDVKMGTANSYDEMTQLLSDNGIVASEAGNIDPKSIKAMIRSNPGLVLIKDGVVKGKWHYNDVPSAKDIKGLLKGK